MFRLICLCVLLALAAAVLLIKVYLMKKSAREIKEKFSERLSSDTNTVIDITGGDRDMLELADCVNRQLKTLRAERQRYIQGDTELKNAVTNISHDLRTPLTAICGYLDLLEREEMSETAEKYLAQIANRTEAMKQLTEELFRYSVVTSSKKLSPERLCLNSVLEESTASFYGAVVQRGISPEIDITDIPVERVLDRSALTRIFGNIIGNAVKYSDGDLLIKMTGDGVITFANTAARLDSVSAERLFDRFYTVETAGNSTGLGLSIAKLLTEQMGGTIKAEYTEKKLVITLSFREG